MNYYRSAPQTRVSNKTDSSETEAEYRTKVERIDSTGTVQERYFMRVITGIARGRRLQTVDGNDVRPTTDNVKEAVFSIIQFYIDGRTFLDAFSGSGQMGIEALSRGAKRAVFVDSERHSINVIRKNLEATGLSASASVVNSDTISFLSSVNEGFDIAYLDPPYKTGLLQAAMSKLPRVMNKSGIIICEHPADEELTEEFGGFVLKKSRRYGKISIEIYSHREVDGL